MSADARDSEVGVDCAVTWRHDWAPHLFSFRTARPEGLSFVCGQFVRIGLAGADGEMVWRAYSIVSPPDAAFLEFYSIVVPDGLFTQPLARIAVGDSIRVAPNVYGFLRCDRFAGGRHLWLLCTGTGIAPFMAMLADGEVWQRFERIVLVHGVRRHEELAYRELVEGRVADPPAPGATLSYVPALTVDQPSSAAERAGRLTTLLADGRLEEATGLPLSVDDSRLMICGNPSMIRDVRVLLGARGMAPVRRETPGQFITENFW